MIILFILENIKILPDEPEYNAITFKIFNPRKAVRKNLKGITIDDVVF